MRLFFVSLSNGQVASDKHSFRSQWRMLPSGFRAYLLRMRTLVK